MATIVAAGAKKEKQPVFPAAFNAFC